jgi:hypothetical protein
VALAVFALAQIGLLAAQLLVIEDQRQTLRKQREIAQIQARRSRPVLEAAQPLARDALAALPELRAGGARLDALMRSAAPLVADLRSARAGDAARATIVLAGRLLEADVAGAVASIAGQLRPEGRLRRLAEDSVRVQRELLGGQREATALMRQSLAIQQETERHTESIDRKTGGSPPVTPPVLAPAG